MDEILRHIQGRGYEWIDLLLSSEVENRIANLEGRSETNADDRLTELIGNLSTSDLAQVIMLMAKRLSG